MATEAPIGTSNLGDARVSPSGFRMSLRRIYQNYTLRVLVQALVTVWAVITFTFFLIRLMPGNPIDVYAEYLMNQQDLSYADAYSRASGQFHLDPNATPLSQYFVTIWDSFCTATWATR